MIERTIDRFDLYPARLAGDSAYGSAEMLRWLVYEHSIESHVTVFDKSAAATARSHERSSPTISRAMSMSAQRARRDHTGHTGQRRRHAPLSREQVRLRRLPPQAALLPKEPVRKVPRSLFEGARDMARHIGQTDAGRASRRQRKKVEILFAHLKRILRLDRLRLRGPNGARDQFLLAASVQKLRKLAKLVPQPTPAAAR